MAGATYEIYPPAKKALIDEILAIVSLEGGGAIQSLSLGAVTGTTQEIEISDGGSGVVLSSASTSDAGLMSAADKTKLNGIGSGASGTVNTGSANRLTYYSSSGTAVSELTAITPSRGLVSDLNGLPVASLASTTEINYLQGLTSNVQTQLDSKLSSFTETDPIYTASIANQVMYKGLIPPSTDLNSYTTTGVYLQRQDSGAASGTNYPTAHAGMLEVQNGNAGEMIFQYYTVWHNYGTSVYKRMYYFYWGDWSKIATTDESVVYGTSGASTLENGFPENSLLYHMGTETDNPSIGDLTGYSINASSGGTSSMQIFMGTGGTAGVNPDELYWRANNIGGSGWPGQWLQVASRQWVQDIPEFANDAAADAALASGSFYKLTGDRTVYQRP